MRLSAPAVRAARELHEREDRRLAPGDPHSRDALARQAGASRRPSEDGFVGRTTEAARRGKALCEAVERGFGDLVAAGRARREAAERAAPLPGRRRAHIEPAPGVVRRPSPERRRPSTSSPRALPGDGVRRREVGKELGDCRRPRSRPSPRRRRVRRNRRRPHGFRRALRRRRSGSREPGSPLRGRRRREEGAAPSWWRASGRGARSSLRSSFWRTLRNSIGIGRPIEEVERLQQAHLGDHRREHGPAGDGGDLVDRREVGRVLEGDAQAAALQRIRDRRRGAPPRASDSRRTTCGRRLQDLGPRHVVAAVDRPTGPSGGFLRREGRGRGGSCRGGTVRRCGAGIRARSARRLPRGRPPQRAARRCAACVGFYLC